MNSPEIRCPFRTIAAGILSLAAIALCGCESVVGSTPQTLVRVIDASANANGVDVYDGSTALQYNVGEATIALDNEDYKLLPNVNVSVSIIIAQHDSVLTIPREALRQDDSTPYVYQIIEDKLRRHEVTVGASNLVKVEVTKGLNDKDVVALNSTSTMKSLRDGSPVKVVQ